MKWSHLPVPGGLFNQSPQLLDEWAVVFELVNRKAASDHEEQMRKSRDASRKKGR